MPFIIACPTCKTKLASATALEFGRFLACRMCKSQFKVTADNQFEAPVAKAKPKDPVEKSDDTTADRSATADRPAADEDEPEKKGQRDQRPRRAKKVKKPKARGSRRSHYVAIGAALLIIGGILFWVFSDSDTFAPQMLAYLPSDVTDISGFEFESFLSEANEKEQGSVNIHPGLGLLRDAGLSGDDFKSIVFGIGKQSGQIMVVRLKKEVDEENLKQDGVDANDSGKGYFKYTGTGICVYVASPSLLVFTRVEATMKGILRREEGKAVIPESLQDVAKLACEGHEWKASIAGGKNDLAWLLNDDEKKVQAVGSFKRLSGRSVQTTNLFLFESPEAAGAAVEAAQKRLDKRKVEVRDGLYKEMKSMNRKQKDTFREQVPTERLDRSESIMMFSRNTYLAPGMLAPITISFPGLEAKPGFPTRK